MWPWLFYTQAKGSERGLSSEGLWWLCETLPLAIAALKIGDGDSGSGLVGLHSCVPEGTCPRLTILLPSGFIPTVTFSRPPSSQPFVTPHHASGHLFLWLTPDISETGRAETADVTHTIKPRAEPTGCHPILTDGG